MLSKIVKLIILFIFLLSVIVQAASNNPLLENITINVGELKPDFSFITTEYFVTVAKDIDKIEIIAIPDDTNAKVNIKGNDNLKEGLNIATITVTAEDGITEKTYHINIAKGETEDVNANLENLYVNGYIIVPQFDKNRVDYIVEIKENEKQLDIVAVPENDNATVEIKGNSNLDGNYNTISVIVTAKDKVTTKTYYINVVKETIGNDAEEQKDMNNESIVNNSENVTISSENVTIIKIVIIIAIFIILALITMIFIRKGKVK